MSTQAAAVLAGRPWTSVAAIAGANGVGPLTITRLRTHHAADSTWSDSVVSAIVAAIEAHVATFATAANALVFVLRRGAHRFPRLRAHGLKITAKSAYPAGALTLLPHVTKSAALTRVDRPRRSPLLEAHPQTRSRRRFSSSAVIPRVMSSA